METRDTASTHIKTKDMRIWRSTTPGFWSKGGASAALCVEAPAARKFVAFSIDFTQTRLNDLICIDLAHKPRRIRPQYSRMSWICSWTKDSNRDT